MHFPTLLALIASLAPASLAAPVHAADPIALADVAVIPIHDGVNRIDRFAADGRAATVFRVWRDNGNAYSHEVYLVTLPPQQPVGPENSAGVVPFDDKVHDLADTITASPFDGERVLGAIRFAGAKLDGEPATVVIDAELGPSKSGVLADHTPAVVTLYALRNPGVEPGTTPDVFEKVWTVHAVGLFCNADMALHVTLNLPLPAGYAGGKAPGGCID